MKRAKNIIWIYTLLVYACMCIVFLTKGEMQTFFLGIQLGTVIGQVIHFVGVIYEKN